METTIPDAILTDATPPTLVCAIHSNLFPPSIRLFRILWGIRTTAREAPSRQITASAGAAIAAVVASAGIVEVVTAVAATVKKSADGDEALKNKTLEDTKEHKVCSAGKKPALLGVMVGCGIVRRVRHGG